MKSVKSFILLIIVLPVLTLGAGLVVGILASRVPASRAAATTAEQRTALEQQLQLSSDQQTQMRRVWESAQGKVQRTFEEAQKLQADRDNALYSLLDKDQQAKFDAIAKDFADRRAELDKNRDKIFQDAVDQSKSLLNPTQVTEYNQILKEHAGTIGDVPKSNG